jgi:hypothetical protein
MNNKILKIVLLILVGIGYQFMFNIYFRQPILDFLHTHTLPTLFAWLIFNIPWLVPLIIMFSLVVNETKKEQKIKSSAVDSDSLEMRLWRGEISLPIAFWKYTVPTILFVLVIGPFLFSGTTNLSLSQVVFRLSAYLVLGLGGLIFTTVGTWRCAGRYSGSMVWRVLTKASVILSYILVMVSLIFAQDISYMLFQF